MSESSNPEDKVILITGATDGLGKELARDMAREGAQLILHGRNEKKGQNVIREIKDDTGNSNLEYYNADFNSLVAMKKLAERVTTDYDRLDVLVNNAGIGFGKPGSGREESEDGYELRFQVNYLSTFVMTMKLLPLLRDSEAGRIVNVASLGQRALDFDDLMLEDHYDGRRAYSQSKLAQIMFTFELAERLDDPTPTVNALHPATFMNTNMVVNAGINPTSSVETGKEAVKYLVESPELSDTTGAFFSGRRPASPDSQAYDKEARERLWEISLEMTGVDSAI